VTYYSILLCRVAQHGFTTGVMTVSPEKRYDS